MTSVLRRNAAMTAHEKPTVGDSKISFVSIDHLGWLRCDGRAVSTDNYGILHNVIGYTFGGAGKLFNLPNASGVVPGISSPTYPTGTLVGEYTHTLTIPEMPSHNHGVAAGVQDASNNLTSSDTHDHSGFSGYIATGITSTNNNFTGITSTNLSFTGVYDSGHSHSYVNQPRDHEVAVSLTTTATADNIDINQTTGVSNANIVDPQHNHTITDPQHNHSITDPTHRHVIDPYTHTHTLNPAGGDQPHNNMQPTLFIGNLFIYSGDPPAGTWPYTVGTNIY